MILEENDQAKWSDKNWWESISDSSPLKYSGDIWPDLKAETPSFSIEGFLEEHAPLTYQSQPPSKEEKPIQLSPEQSALLLLAMAALGFILAVWMISTGKLGIGYDASAVNRTIAQAQTALDSLQTERANLERTIAELQAVQAQFETQIRTNQQEQLRWAVIGAFIGAFMSLVIEHILPQAYEAIMPKRVRDAIAAQPKRVVEWVKGRLRTTSLEQELALQFRDAPSELKAPIDLAIRAIGRKQFGEAFDALQQAQKLIDKNKDELADWHAETAVVWALYYYRGGPEPELEPHAMWRSIRRAKQLEPENERLNALIAQIRAGTGKAG